MLTFRSYFRIIIFFMITNMLPAYAEAVPDAATLMSTLKLDQNQQESLRQGEMVSFNVSEQDETELAAGVAAYLPSSPDKIISIIRNGDLTSIETDIVAMGTIPVKADADTFNKFAFTKDQIDEAENFLEAEAGDDFNLSTAEIQAIQAAASGNKDARETANHLYRDILLHRWQSYRAAGLKGIAAYDRGDSAADPAGELREMAESNKVLARYFPALAKAWLNYPADMPANAEETFFWFNLTVEDRPTPILSHRVIFTAEQGAVILSRQFYVGHSYNASQLTVGCLPYQDGSVIFYASRISTDQVAGMGSSLKHKIGREQMRSEMIKRIQKLKRLL